MNKEIRYPTIPYNFSDLIGKTIIAITDNPYTNDYLGSLNPHPCEARKYKNGYYDEPLIYLVGIFESDTDYEHILFVSDDKDSSPIYKNWRLCKLVTGVTNINIDSHFKFIRDKINSIELFTINGNINNNSDKSLEVDNIECPCGPDQGEYYIVLHTNLKQIKLGNKHVECYQESIWEFV